MFRWRLVGLLHNLGVVFLISAVLGSMYGGIARPSEAATIGGVSALLASGSQLSMTLQNLILACLGAVWTVSIIRLIVWGAYSLSIIMGYIGVPRILAGQNGTLGLAPIALIMLLLSLYAVLGCVLEGMSTIVMTLPITMPLVWRQVSTRFGSSC